MFTFAAGFLFGTFRVLLLVPLMGDRYAELCETPFMFVAIILIARWINTTYCRDYSNSRLLSIGLIAVSLILLADILVGISLRGMTFSEVFLIRDSVSDTVYYCLLIIFALMPWILGRR
jgi:hypothetical protein